MIDQQFQSYFFRLPPELRNAVYSNFILLGSTSQHITGSREWGGGVRRVIAHRFPCLGPVDDASFLAGVVDPERHEGPEALGFEPGSYHSRRRGGHLCCVWDPDAYSGSSSRLPTRAVMRQDRGPRHLLRSPTALLRSCKRVCEEATPYLYSAMRFQSIEDMVTILDLMPPASINRLHELECVWTLHDMAEGYVPPPKNERQGEEWRLLCKNLRKLSQQHSLKLTFDLWHSPGRRMAYDALMGIDMNMGPFPKAIIHGLKPIKNLGNFEIDVYILDTLGRNEDKGMAVETANEDRPFTLRRKVEPAWFQEVLAHQAIQM
ncbi:hypothetical protein GQ53DRAFT_822550 [Thozetella sp. PMI_491]|nr:hypothetical protein GQ53DRAFT_822550 [Thozetella sp. PMI_491]